MACTIHESTEITTLEDRDREQREPASLRLEWDE
jgi:hypothetical protein